MLNEFLSCDWGTSAFRLRLVETPSLKVLAEESSDEGNTPVFAAWQQAQQPPAQRVAFYLAILKQHLTRLEAAAGRSLKGVPLVISGMASSTIGLLEVPYKPFPFAADGSDLLIHPIAATEGLAHDILLISGVKTDDDVMRGEEVQLVGCQFSATAADQLFLHPGTHAKHVVVRQGQAVALQTFMTGELFALLTTHGILAGSVEKGQKLDDGRNLPSFEQGVRASQQGSLLHTAFLVRTNDLFRKFTKPENYYYLSGLLIGTELKELAALPPSHITLAGEPALLALYQAALRVLGVADSTIRTQDAEEITLCGQWAVYQQQHPEKSA